jgi:serine/threonine protein kinase
VAREAAGKLLSGKSVSSDDVQTGLSRDVSWSLTAAEERLSGPSGRMLGRYRLETLLGRGGMAEVWRAVDTKLGRPVALKVISADHAADRSFVERFLREAKVVASLEHPNILPVYDAGEDEGRPFLVMPFLDGGTLRDRLQGRPVLLGVAAGWIGQLASALDAAHEAGVLHRDVKPANVLIGKGDRLFLADFGIARMLGSGAGLTGTGMVVGTPIYMAPEQAQGHPASPASDRYSLAVVAYELLAGRPPFDGESPLSLMHQHVSSPAPALSTCVGGLPAGLDAVFATALAKEPEARHRTCEEFAGAIALFVPTGIAGAALSGPAATAPTIP